MVNIIEIKTVQSAAFRVLIEALKEILTDANFEFDETGIKIIAMDSSHTVLVHLKLKHDSFEHFVCKKKRTLGINMLNMFKLIKTMGNNDSLTLFLEEDNESVLCIKIENSEKNSITNYRLNLMDLHEDNIEIPPATFDSVITMPSVDFQKICRDMHNLADNIEIKSLSRMFLVLLSYLESIPITTTKNFFFLNNFEIKTRSTAETPTRSFVAKMTSELKTFF